MREILFKAKRINWREFQKEEWWIEGLPSYGINGEISEIEHWKDFANCEVVEIDPETLCQYTGKTDIEKRKIFTGDIIQSKIGDKYIVKIYKTDIRAVSINGKRSGRMSSIYWEFSKVIGNIFDNPELLERS